MISDFNKRLNSKSETVFSLLLVNKARPLHFQTNIPVSGSRRPNFITNKQLLKFYAVIYVFYDGRFLR